MSDPRMVIWSPNAASRGRDLRIVHRHEGRWVELAAGMPMMTPARPGRRRRWTVVFRCPVCGGTIASLAPV